MLDSYTKIFQQDGRRLLFVFVVPKVFGESDVPETRLNFLGVPYVPFHGRVYRQLRVDSKTGDVDPSPLQDPYLLHEPSGPGLSLDPRGTSPRPRAGTDL